MRNKMKLFSTVIILCLFAFQMNGQGSSILTKDLEIKMVTDFDWVFDDHDSGAHGDISIWKPKVPSGYYILGYQAINRRGGKPNAVAIVVKGLTKGAIAYPTGYKWIWNNSGSGSSHDGATVYEPIPPKGYVALGSVIARSYGKPALEEVVCIRKDLVVAASIGRSIWTDAGSGGDADGSAWMITSPNMAKDSKISYLTSGSFVFVKSHGKPGSSAVANAIRLEMPTDKKLVADPKPRLTGMSRPSMETEPILASISYLPCISVQDPAYKGRRAEQIKRTPIYTLERYDYYKLQDFNTNGDIKDGEMGFEYSYGMEQTQEKSMQTTFESSITAEAGVESGIYSASVSVTMSFAVSHSETHSTTKSESTTFTRNYRVPKQGAGALFSLSHKYILKNADGNPIKTWNMDTKYSHFAAYPIGKAATENNFVENFSNNTNSWQMFNNSDYATSMTNGRINMDYKKKVGLIYTAAAKPIDTDRDFVISTKIQHKGGINDNGYGFMFGRDAGTNFQSFEITANGNYRILELKNNVWLHPQPWTYCKHLKTGNVMNTLQIEKRGNKVNFYINEYFVKEMSFKQFAGNNLGFIVHSKQSISMDELTITYL
jgi:hypothetical protein